MIRVEPATSIDIRCSDRGWRFAEENRGAIDSYWKEVVAAKPTLWNGAALLCTSASISGGRFEAELVETDYASFVAWRDWGRPDKSVVNLFGVPAAFSSDGAMIVGVMAGWTLNAGKAYPPSGTLEPKDIRPDRSVDVIGNMRTEMLEEAGLDLDHARAGETVVIFEGPRLAIARRYDFDLHFSEIEKAFAAHAAQDPQPELERITGIRGASQIDSTMPGYAQEIIRYFLGN
jgi:8-oxo-dGTP pyrophosphatase MutT (NUDIX family)